MRFDTQNGSYATMNVRAERIVGVFEWTAALMSESLWKFRLVEFRQKSVRWGAFRFILPIENADVQVEGRGNFRGFYC